jgi:hypothetical protein
MPANLGMRVGVQLAPSFDRAGQAEAIGLRNGSVERDPAHYLRMGIELQLVVGIVASRNGCYRRELRLLQRRVAVGLCLSSCIFGR